MNEDKNLKLQTPNPKIENITQWIANTVKSAGFSRVVIGLSGGIDSALSVTLAVHALGKEHVYPVLLPYGNLHAHGVTDAKRVIEFLKIPQGNVHVIDIQRGVEGILSHVILERGESRPIGSPDKKTKDEGVMIKRDSIAALQNDTSSIRKGNIMARVRMIYLFDLAKKIGALVCGTENRTEHYLGYFTRFGDEASDIEPIRSLYKTEVWEMAKALGLPKEIIEKEPTAGLWEGQTDEGELGFSYKDADRVLQLHIDEGISAEEIVAKGIREDIVQRVLDRVAKNEFKHVLPYVCQ